MEYVIEGNEIYVTYDSVAEFTDIAANGSFKSFTGGWSGVESWEEAVTFARDGWEEKLPSALDIAQNAVTKARKEKIITRLEPTWGVAGGAVDVGRFVQGVPECMINFPLRQAPKEGRIVSLVVSRGATGGVQEETIVAHGQRVTALALALEEMGLGVEIWLDWPKEIGSRKYYQRVLLKRVNASLDPALLMYGMGHASLHRAVHFRSLQTLPAPFGSRSVGGSVQRWKKCEEMYEKGTIFIQTIQTGSSNLNAQKFLTDQLRALGLLAE